MRKLNITEAVFEKCYPGTTLKQSSAERRNIILGKTPVKWRTARLHSSGTVLTVANDKVKRKELLYPNIRELLKNKESVVVDDDKRDILQVFLDRNSLPEECDVYKLDLQKGSPVENSEADGEEPAAEEEDARAIRTFSWNVMESLEEGDRAVNVQHFTSSLLCSKYADVDVLHITAENIVNAVVTYVLDGLSAEKTLRNVLAILFHPNGTDYLRELFEYSRLPESRNQCLTYWERAVNSIKIAEHDELRMEEPANYGELSEEEIPGEQDEMEGYPAENREQQVPFSMEYVLEHIRNVLGEWPERPEIIQALSDGESPWKEFLERKESPKALFILSGSQAVHIRSFLMNLINMAVKKEAKDNPYSVNRLLMVWQLDRSVPDIQTIESFISNVDIRKSGISYLLSAYDMETVDDCSKTGNGIERAADIVLIEPCQEYIDRMKAGQDKFSRKLAKKMERTILEPHAIVGKVVSKNKLFQLRKIWTE